VHSIDTLDALLTAAMDSEKTDVESEPAAKKRKLAASGSFGNFGSQATQSSFTEVLERLREEGGNTVSQSNVYIGWPIRLLKPGQLLKVARTTGRDLRCLL
jgi:hypothetical protein